MPRRPYDPLAFVPSPDVIREKLRDTVTLAERLRLLLKLSERIHKPITSSDLLDSPIDAKERSNVA